MSFLYSNKHSELTPVLPQLIRIDWPNKLLEVITKWMMFSCVRHFWMISWMCFAAETTELNLPEDADFLSLKFLGYVILYPLIEVLALSIILRGLAMTKFSLTWNCALTGLLFGSFYLSYYGDFTALIEIPFMVVLARLMVREPNVTRAISYGYLFLFLTRFTQFFVAYTINHIIYSS